MAFFLHFSLLDCPKPTLAGHWQMVIKSPGSGPPDPPDPEPGPALGPSGLLDWVLQWMGMKFIQWCCQNQKISAFLVIALSWIFVLLVASQACDHCIVFADHWTTSDGQSIKLVAVPNNFGMLDNIVKLEWHCTELDLCLLCFMKHFKILQVSRRETILRWGFFT